MKRVAVLTFQRSPNYGAVLQAYALQKIVLSMGLECELLDLLRPIHFGYQYTDRNKPLPAYVNRGSLRQPNNGIGSQFKGAIKDLLGKLVGFRKLGRFESFERAYMRFSGHSYTCSDELYAEELEYDCCIAGSDQVWNPTYPYNPEPYFLTFMPEGKRRIAYAPSFGVNEIDASVRETYATWLSAFDYLSVRETQGSLLIKELTGRSAPVVLDPTLLLMREDWQAVARHPRIRQPYIFCYSLGDPPGLMELCRHVQRMTGYRIVKIGKLMDIFEPGLRSVHDAGPREFLGYIMNAAVVITDSFHGTVLSINMRKPFFVVPSALIGPTSRNSRIYSILDILGLDSRMYSPGDRLPVASEFALDYAEVDVRLDKERRESVSFLRQSLGVARC